jgi:hypothetical protein
MFKDQLSAQAASIAQMQRKSMQLKESAASEKDELIAELKNQIEVHSRLGIKHLRSLSYSLLIHTRT